MLFRKYTWPFSSLIWAISLSHHGWVNPCSSYKTAPKAEKAIFGYLGLRALIIFLL